MNITGYKFFYLASIFSHAVIKSAVVTQDTGC